MYYLQSRYYDPEVCRFINADEIGYLGVDGTLASYSLFTYCSNNPINGYDPTGHWNWRTFWDGVVTVVAAIAGIGTAIKNSLRVGSITAGLETFGSINNAANAIYYNNFSDGESEMETTNVDLPYEEMKSDYVDRYINRWDRLDYTNHETQSESYDSNAWRFYSEYSLHMHLWNIVKPFQGKGIWLADRIGKSAIHAHVDPLSPDPDWKIQLPTEFVGFLGL